MYYLNSLYECYSISFNATFSEKASKKQIYLLNTKLVYIIERAKELMSKEVLLS